ncbi:MAG TPA: VOC family protein [Planctomycetota bacterium]
MNRPVHFEICAGDPVRLSAFYARVFGWKIASFPGPQSYWFVKTGEKDDAGIDGGFMGKHFPQPVIHTVAVESLEDTLDAIEAAGGSLVHGPNEVPGVGRHAYCTDPEGIFFGVMQPGEASS